MFDTLTERLDHTFRKLRSRGKLHPKQVDNAMADIRTALLESDAAVEVVDDFLARVRERALSEEVMKSLTPGQQVVKVVNDELTVTMLRTLRAGVVARAAVAAVGRTTYLTTSPQIVQRIHVVAVEITADTPFPWQVDGDYLGEVAWLEVAYEPDCLTVVIP